MAFTFRSDDQGQIDRKMKSRECPTAICRQRGTSTTGICTRTTRTGIILYEAVQVFRWYSYEYELKYLL
eukprot:scaffold112264_cov18-Prasinocladus_malaysianus.AAC.1